MFPEVIVPVIVLRRCQIFLEVIVLVMSFLEVKYVVDTAKRLWSAELTRGQVFGARGAQQQSKTASRSTADGVKVTRFADGVLLIQLLPLAVRPCRRDSGCSSWCTSYGGKSYADKSSRESSRTSSW